MRRKAWGIIIAVGVLFIGMLIVFSSFYYIPEHSPVREIRSLRGYVAHDPIKIDSNGEFNAAHGVTGGSGTEDDPFIISGWLITTGSTGIYVGGTTAYFVIENCVINGSSMDYGIHLYNVKNGAIRYTSIINADWGINLQYTENIEIETTEVKVMSSSAYGTGGIYMEYSNNTRIHNSTVYNYGTGIWSPDSTNTTAYQNFIRRAIGDMPVGIYLGERSVAKRNYVMDSGYGIGFKDRNRVWENVIVNSTYQGISAEGDNNFMEKNILYYNRGTEDYWDSSHPPQASDSGSYNHWFFYGGPYLKPYGNYWREWANNNDSNDADHNGLVDYPYAIDGSAGSTDEYPLKYTVPIPPHEFMVNEGSGYVNISWNLPLGDCGKEITEFRIYRNGTLIATVPGTQLYYNDTSVDGETKYYYRVTAVNDEGEGIPSPFVLVETSPIIPEITLFVVIPIFIAAYAIYTMKRKK